MTKEQLIAMAREAGFSVKNFKPPVITAQHSNGSWVSVGDELERFATLVRNAALEEAKKAALSFVDTDEWPISEQSTTAEDMAKAIESLKEPTT